MAFTLLDVCTVRADLQGNDDEQRHQDQQHPHGDLQCEWIEISRLLFGILAENMNIVFTNDNGKSNKDKSTYVPNCRFITEEFGTLIVIAGDLGPPCQIRNLTDCPSQETRNKEDIEVSYDGTFC